MPEEEKTEQTEEEIQAIRAEIAAELDAEESGEKAPETKPEVKEVEDEKKEEEKPEIVPDDPWEGVNPVLKKSYEDMSAKIKELSGVDYRLKQTEKRIGSLQNQLQAKKAEEKAAPTKEEIEKAAEDESAWNELKEDFPEWATAIDARLAKDKEKFESEYKKLSDSQVTSKQELEDKIANLQKLTGTFEKSLLENRFPDWEATVKDPKYQEWITKQPEDVKKLTRSKFAKDAVKVLDKFTKEQTTKTKSSADIAAERKQRLKQSVSVDGKKSKPIKSEADMNDAELRKKAAAEIWAD